MTTFVGRYLLVIYLTIIRQCTRVKNTFRRYHRKHLDVNPWSPYTNADNFGCEGR